MAVVKYRVHEVAKDFNVSNKEILDLLKDRFGGEQRNHMAALETDELNYIFEVMSQKHAVASFEPYFKAGEQARSQTESAKKARAEKEREQALLEEAKQREQAAAQAALTKQRVREEAAAAIAAKKAREAAAAAPAAQPASAQQTPAQPQQAAPARQAAHAAPAGAPAHAAPAAGQAKPAVQQAPAPQHAPAQQQAHGQPHTPAQQQAGAPGAPAGSRPLRPNTNQAPAGSRPLRPNTNQAPAGGRPLRPNTNQTPAAGGRAPAAGGAQGQAGGRPLRPNTNQRPQQGAQGARPAQAGQGGRPAPGNAPRPAQGGRPASAQQGAAPRPAQPAQPQKPQQTTRREGVRVVDTRAGSVDLSKFDERFDQLTPDKARNMGGGKHKVGKRPNQRPTPYQKRETEAEKLKRLELEKARRAPLHIAIPDEIVVSELATRLKKTNADVVKKLFLMGFPVTANDTIDFDTAALVSEEFGALYTKEVVVTIEERLIDDSEDKEEDLVPRDPVVVVMGHVDHGKTSLLDAIRHTHVTAGEAGGITQHIGAYKVEISGREITFLDTPGHAAFTSMRARGANVTDIAILVIAADDGIMPQTVEAINHAKAAGVSIIVAINKIDKPDANPDRVKQELTEHGLVPEEWGGDVICVPVSAVTHEGIDTLLEMVLLTADMRELKANPSRRARGTVIEAQLDKGRGPVATVLVQNGTLHAGDVIIAGTSVGRVRVMTDDKGRKLKDAGPSTPVEIMGLAEVPQAGDLFYAVEDEKMARELAEQRKAEEKAAQAGKVQKVSLDDLFNQIQQGDVKELNLIVKADVMGSAEAVQASLEKLSNDEVRVRVIHSGVGAISGSDLMLAEASNAIIIGFNVRPDAAIREDAAQRGVDIRTYRIIYECIEEMEAAMKGMLAPKFREVVQGHAEVRQIFKVSGVGTIAGCYVKSGKINRNSSVRVLRDSVVVAETKIDSLRRFKDDVREVAEGFECGIGLERFNDIKEGDVIEAFVMEEYHD
ncbi:MAG TPA: translation initiation factor IF-2 [Candidatus Galloscillospira excrementipullorum]|nr:translation initiation factor IF-2 [Candidatus Galloscillospira excrementipullorum]